MKGKQMKYELILFDLDGTLVNTLLAITKTVNCALEELNLKTYSVEKAQNLIGHGVQGIVEKITKLENYNINKDKLAEIIRKYYEIYFNYDVKLYDGIDKLLDYLEKNKIKKGIITNKDHNLAIETVEKNLKKWNFVEIIGADDEKYPRKPNPYNVNVISEKLNINKNKILYVGDMEIDVETAKNAGVDVVYCNWGFGENKEDGINNVEELIEKLVK